MGRKLAFDSLGRATWRSRFEGTALGVNVERVVNAAGWMLSEKRGVDIEAGLHSHDRATHDRKGRRRTHTRHDGADSRTAILDYDGADPIQVDHPPRSQGTTRTTTYGYQPNGPRRISVTDPLGVHRITSSNDLGQPLAVDVDFGGSPPSHLAGPDRVELSYGSGSACGCSQTGKPVLARTLEGGEQGQEITRVSRDYDPRGRPTTERISVRGSAELATAFGYNENGWLDEILYPGSTAGRLTLLHRPDGVVSEQRWGAQGQEVPLVVYEYRGNQDRRRTIHQFDGVSLVVGLTTLDARGWSASASWTLASDPQQEVFSDEVARNGDGLITSRRQPNGLWSYLDYDGPNWVVSERWNVDAADPTGGDSWVEHVYTRSSYGEVTQVEELGPAVATGETNIWSYSRRDDAGFFGAIDDQVLRYNENDPNLAPEYIEHLMRDRQHSFDDAGNEHVAQFVFESFQTLDSYVETTAWAYTLDAWGRVIEAERTRSRAGSPDKVGTFRFTYDAFGRLVSHETETQNDPLVEDATVYHALLGNRILHSKKNPEADFELNPYTRMPEKLRETDTTDGSYTVQSFISGFYGNLAAGNGDGAVHQSSEAPTESTTFTLRGYLSTGTLPPPQGEEPAGAFGSDLNIYATPQGYRLSGSDYLPGYFPWDTSYVGTRFTALQDEPRIRLDGANDHAGARGSSFRVLSMQESTPCPKPPKPGPDTEWGRYIWMPEQCVWAWRAYPWVQPETGPAPEPPPPKPAAQPSRPMVASAREYYILRGRNCCDTVFEQLVSGAIRPPRGYQRNPALNLWGLVVCCDGRLYACDFPLSIRAYVESRSGRPADPNGVSLIRYCATLHERRHIAREQARREQGRTCLRCDSANPNPHSATWHCGARAHAIDEAAVRARGGDCLDSARRACATSACRATIDAFAGLP